MLNAEISEALVSYLRFRDSAIPGARWDHEDTPSLVVKKDAEEIVTDLRKYRPDWAKYPVENNLVLAADDVRAVFAVRYPGLSDEALDALRWAFAWQWR